MSDKDEPESPENRAETGPEPTRPDIAKRFRPGQTGNPGGRPKAQKVFTETARSYSVVALKRLAQIALNAGNSPAAVRACEIIIERAWGKAPQPVTGADGGPIDLRFRGAARSALEDLVNQQLAENPDEETDEGPN